MAKILETKSIYYNDVNLIATKPTAVKSRYKDIPKELDKIIVSPMAAVVGEKFAIEADKLGLTVCLHRFCDAIDEANLFNKLINKDRHFVSIGLEDWDRVNILSNNNVKNWLIDTANGYLPQIIHTIDILLNKYSTNKIMVGNIHSRQGVELYKKYAHLLPNNLYIRTGIAGGCFIPESLVRTDKGFISIKNLEKGDKVQTHTGEYCYILNKFEYDKNEELIKINDDITCTKNHQFYVVHNKYADVVNDNNINQYAEWIKAESLTNEYFLIEM